MTVVGTAEIIAHAVTTGFERELETGAQRGFKVVEEEARVAGVSAGESMAGGVAASEAKMTGSWARIGAAGKRAFMGIGLAAGASLAESVHLAEGMQKTDAAIAGSTHQSVAHATAIGDAFLKTAGVNTYAGTELAKAYSNVAGELQNLNGKHLTAAQSIETMKAASALAEAKQMDLGAATKATADTMQAYGLGVEHAGHVTDVLYNTSAATGQGVEQLSTTFGRLHSKLGDSAGSLSQVGGLLLDMTEHGITGRVALSSLNVGMTTIQKSAGAVTGAQQRANDALGQMPPQLQRLARAYQDGSLSQRDFNKATASLPPAQRALVTEFNSGTKAVHDAEQKYKDLGVTVFDSKGRFVGMGSVIDQLEPKFRRMTQQQQLNAAAQIFGQGAAKQMTTIINAGSEAYDKATRAVARHGSAESAAQKQARTLHGQLETLKSTLEDISTEVGEKVIPPLTHMATAFLHATQYVLNHKATLVILSGIITGVLGTAITVFTVNKMAAFGRSFIQAGQHLGVFAAETTATSTVVETEMAGMEAAAVESSAGIDVALGSTGIGAILIGVGIAATLLVTHWHQVMHAIETGAEDALHFVEDHWKLLALILLGPLGPIVAGFGQFHSEIIGVFHSIEGDVAHIWGAVADTASAVPGRIAHFFTSLPERIEDELSGLAGAMVHIGESVVSGVIQGIENKLGDLGHEAGKIASKVKDGVGSLLSIRSPSKVMHQYGVWTVQGFQEGIADQTSKTTMSTPMGRIEYSVAKSPIATAAGAGGLGSNASAVMSFFMGKGLTRAQSAGITGNLQQESGINPSEHGGYLAQWGGGRLSGLQAFAQQQGTSVTNLTTQLQYMWRELNGSESGALRSLKKTHDPGSAALVVSNQYERPLASAANNPGRQAYARAAAGLHVSGSRGGGSSHSEKTVERTAKSINVKIAEQTAEFRRKIAEQLASVKDGTKAQRAAMQTEVTNEKAAFAIRIATERASAREQSAAQRRELARQTSDQRAGTTQLNNLLRAIHTGSLASLKTAVENAHLRGVDRMVTTLSHDHSKALAALSKQLERTYKEAQEALGKQQAAQDAKDLATWLAAVDEAQAADIDSTTRRHADDLQGQAQAIQDASRVKLDQMAEQGKTGADLVAAQAQTALDSVQQNSDAQIARDQLAVDDAAKGSKVDQARAAQQLAYDQAQQSVDLAQAQANLDLQNAAAAAADAAAQAAADAATPDDTSDTTTVPADTPSTDAPTPYFHFTLYGSGLTAADLMSEVGWALKTGAVPATPPLSAAVA